MISVHTYTGGANISITEYMFTYIFMLGGLKSDYNYNDIGSVYYNMEKVVFNYELDLLKQREYNIDPWKAKSFYEK